MKNAIESDNVHPAPTHSTLRPAVITGDSARQGPKGARILYVLIGMLLSSIFLGGAVLWIWRATTQ